MHIAWDISPRPNSYRANMQYTRMTSPFSQIHVSDDYGIVLKKLHFENFLGSCKWTAKTKKLKKSLCTSNNVVKTISVHMDSQ